MLIQKIRASTGVNAPNAQSLIAFHRRDERIEALYSQKVDLPVPFSRLTRTRTGKCFIGCK